MVIAHPRASGINFRDGQWRLWLGIGIDPRFSIVAVTGGSLDNLSGQTIKGYQLIEYLGSGGFGSVYRAYQPSVGREVAMKIILPLYADQPEFIRRFEGEAQKLTRLEHPYI